MSAVSSKPGPVGFIGLGKLGLPVAYAIARSNVEVYGYDPHVVGPPDDLSFEAGLAETKRIADKLGTMHFATMQTVLAVCDPVFIAVQTPHEREYEGVTRLPADRRDFDYTYLRRAVADAVKCAEAAKRSSVTLAIISTVLPGTMDREIRPLLPGNVDLVYTPSFIAMGTTIRDFTRPEFYLQGSDDEAPGSLVSRVYRWVCENEAPIFRTGIREAELTKVAYNTFIGAKLAFANTIGEVAHRTGTNVDEVVAALKLADRRLISDAYLEPGMGDGGGCHPRDNIALSWLARETGMSFDFFDAVMKQREQHAQWLADLVLAEARERDLPVGILGNAYKPGSAITTGSPAMLVYRMLLDGGAEPPVIYDPWTDHRDWPVEARVWLVGCKHPMDGSEQWPPPLLKGSVVIDPWRYFPEQNGVDLIRVGDPSIPPQNEGTSFREGRIAA